MSNKQVGFTLVELMIALALGLVISAAATMLEVKPYNKGRRVYKMMQILV